MKKDKSDKPILLEKRSLNAYLDPTAPIYLHSNGNIVCGETIFKTSPMEHHQYPFIRDYLKKKKLKFDISDFSYKDLGDIVMYLQNNNKSSISLKKLIEIYSYRNQVSKIRDYKIKKIKYIAYRRFWKKYKDLGKNKQAEESQKLRKELIEKEELVNRLINKF